MAVWISSILVVVAASCISAQQIENHGPCVTPHGESSFCIPLEQCPELNNMVEKAKAKVSLSDEDKLLLKQSQCGMHNNKVVVCCSRKHLLPEPGVCGRVKQGRIFGGNATKLDEYPWMALIMYSEFDESRGHHCGGSLISNRYVLTAAHCIECIPDYWKPSSIRLGEWDTTTNPDCEIDINNNTFCADKIVEVPIEKVIVHPSYQLYSMNQFSDIALIRLAHDIAYTDFIEPICLPLIDVLKRSTFENIIMDVVGWGKTEQGFIRSDKKLKAGVPVVSLDDCRRVYQSHRLGKGKRNLTSSQLCAGGEIGVDSCGGDSGGPLIAVDSSNEEQAYNFIAGIISYGPLKCGMQGWPSVYTRVSEYVDWILKNIEP